MMALAYKKTECGMCHTKKRCLVVAVSAEPAPPYNGSPSEADAYFLGTARRTTTVSVCQQCIDGATP